MQIQTGIITISDRASKGLYDDLGGPALKKAAEGYSWKVTAESLVADEKNEIQRAIREQISKGCQLILTTGGTDSPSCPMVLCWFPLRSATSET